MRSGRPSRFATMRRTPVQPGSAASKTSSAATEAAPIWPPFLRQICPPTHRPPISEFARRTNYPASKLSTASFVCSASVWPSLSESASPSEGLSFTLQRSPPPTTSRSQADPARDPGQAGGRRSGECPLHPRSDAQPAPRRSPDLGWPHSQSQCHHHHSLARPSTPYVLLSPLMHAFISPPACEGEVKEVVGVTEMLLLEPTTAAKTATTSTAAPKIGLANLD